MPSRLIPTAVIAAAAAVTAGFATAPAGAAPADALTRLTLTPAGEVLVSDYRNRRILVLDAATLAPAEEIAIDGRPLGVAWIGGRLYVGNDTTSSVEVYERDGKGRWKARRGLAPRKGTAPRPTDIAGDPARGLVFVSSVEKQAVLVFDARGRPLREIGGPGVLRIPTGVAIDPVAGRVLVSDMGDPRGGIFGGPEVPASIQIFDYEGAWLGSISGGAAAPGFRFSRPQGLAVDGAGRIYLADSFLGQVLVFDGASHAGLSVIGSKGPAPGQLLHPLDVGIDPATLDVLVTSRMTGRVEVFDGGAAQ